MTRKNPWRGLASYEEPQGNEHDYLFCGRDDETLDMVRLIENNLFVTLYGSSGIGKTSLLKAGVIPILRRKDYFPLYVRLSQEDNNISYAEAIVNKLRNSGLHEERRAALEHADGNDRLYLWNYFATTRFRNADGREVYPVIILDQFEEVFRDADKRKAELLLKQIYLLLNDELEMPVADGYSADTNYRFVASIREDFLFVLEDSIDENSLDLYKNNRYRLRPMKPENARQVVLVPGKDCIKESQKQEIAEKLVALAKRNKHNDIDTILLSLVCAGTFDKRAGDRITFSDLSIWKNNPMDVYYHDAVRGLSADQIRYIQKNLIRDDGSRRRVAVEDAKAALGEETYKHLTQGQSRMLTLSEQGQVELLHDQMALAVFEERKAFEEKERRKKLRRRYTFVGFIILTILVVFFIQNSRLKKQEWKMMENHSRFVAEKTLELADNADFPTAQRLVLEVLPKDLDNPDRPYTVEAEQALRNSFSQNIRVFKHTNFVISASYSPDGRCIVSVSRDHTVRIWDVETGAELRRLEGHTWIVNTASYSPDGRYIVSASNDKTVRIWDAETGAELRRLEGHTSHVNTASYSPDGRYIVSASDDKTVRIWDTETGLEIKKLEENHAVNSANYSFDGRYIVSASWDYTVRIWETETGLELRRFEGHTDHVNSSSYSPDGRYVVSASDDKTVRIWESETGLEIKKLWHTSPVNLAIYSPDGRYIVSALNKRTVIIWPFPPLQDLIDQTRERFKDRPLTPEERRMYYLE